MVAVITGKLSRGIGRSIALAFANEEPDYAFVREILRV